MNTSTGSRTGFGLLSLFILNLALALTPSFARAQSEEVQSMTVEGNSKASTESEAIAEITAWATATAAREQVIEVLGEAKYQKNRALVESKVIRQSAKFIPVVNPGAITKSDDGTWKMTVELRYSTNSLRQVILDAGLLSDNESPLTVLPLVAIVDRVRNQSFRWWASEEKEASLVRWHDLVLEKVQIIASDSNFHVVASKSLNRSAIQDPTVVSSDYLSPMQIEKLARAEHSTLALVGQLTRAPSGQLLSLNMRVENAVTHKVVAEVARSWHTESNSEEASFLAKIKSETEIATNELTTQLHQNWLHGTIMSNSFRLVIRGLETPNQEAAMRSSLARAYKEIKSVAPRAFEHGEIEYEIEFNGDFKAFTEKMKLMTAPGFDMHFREAETVANNRSRVVIEAKPRVSDKASDRK